MITLTRRAALHSSAALAAATLVRPYFANATATVWWTQGFAQEEDVAFKKIVGDYEKASGNTIDHSIVPYAPMRQKIVSAVTSGVVPDLFQNTPAEIIALYAWQDKLVDVSDIVEPHREEYTDVGTTASWWPVRLAAGVEPCPLGAARDGRRGQLCRVDTRWTAPARGLSG